MTFTRNIFIAALGLTLSLGCFCPSQVKGQTPISSLKGADFNLPWEIINESTLPKTFWKDHMDRSWFDDTDPMEVKEYHLSTAEQLAGLAAVVNSGDFNFKNKIIKIDKDIDLSQHLWWAIAYHHKNVFAGTIDGQNHVIRGLRYNQGNALFVPHNPDDKFSGFVGQCLGGKVLNLTFVGARMITMATSAVVAGNLFDNAEVSNCHVIDCYVQTLINVNGNPDFRGDVGGIGYAGILVGGVSKGCRIIDCTVKDSKFSGIDKCAAVAGGVWDGAIIKNTFAENVDIFSLGGNGTAGYVGTIMPFMATNDTEITNGYVTGRVACASPAASFIGGFVGRCGNLTVLKNCYSAVKVKSQLPDPITSYPVNIGGFAGQMIGFGPNDAIQNTFFDQELAGVVYSMGVSRVMLPPLCHYGAYDDKHNPIPLNSEAPVDSSSVHLYLPFKNTKPKDLKIYYKAFTIDEMMKWDQHKKDTYYPTAEDGIEYHQGDVITIESPQRLNYIIFFRAEYPNTPENNNWVIVRFNDDQLPFNSNVNPNNKLAMLDSNVLRAAGQEYPLANGRGKLVGFNTASSKGQDALNMLNTDTDVTWKVDPTINNGYPYYRYNATLSTNPVQKTQNTIISYIDANVLHVEGQDIQSVKVFDMQGRILVEKVGLGGVQDVTLDASNLTGGVYLIVIDTADGTQSNKLVVE